MDVLSVYWNYFEMKAQTKLTKIWITEECAKLRDSRAFESALCALRGSHVLLALRALMPYTP